MCRRGTLEGGGTAAAGGSGGGMRRQPCINLMPMEHSSPVGIEVWATQ